MVARALGTIERNALAQARLVEDLLDVSRIITGKLHLDVRPIDLCAVVQAAVDATLPAAEAKGTALAVDLCARCDFVGDPVRLQQVIGNLLSNGVKFTPQGGRVQVRLRETESAVEITVSDTGEGIARRFLPYVFDRFRQEDVTTTRAHGGLGLGLSLVRNLVELHGGTVKVESPGRGKGAQFTVGLPRRPAVAASSAPSPVDAAAGTARLEGVKVLVVDDEADARELIAMVLESYGAEVRTATSVIDAVEACRQRSPMSS